MKNFESITELQILYYAIDAVLEKLLREEDNLTENPESVKAKAKTAKYRKQYNELHVRVLELEREKKQ